MALGTAIDRDLRRVTYQVCLRQEPGFFGLELQQLAALLREHDHMGHLIIDTRVVMPTYGALPTLVVTVSGLLPNDETWLAQRDLRMGTAKEASAGVLHDARTINESGPIARRLEGLSPKERVALDEALTALYFDDSSEFRGSFWSIIRGLLDLDLDEVNAFDERIWVKTMNPDWGC